MPQLPPATLAFAKAVAALAEQNGIEAFELQIEPRWREMRTPEVNIMGKLKFLYRSVDGRGRPSTKLHVHFDTNITHAIRNDPESFS